VGQPGGLDGVTTGVQLDNTWTAWSVTNDLDHAEAKLPSVAFRWRRVSQANNYTCEVEFLNSGKTARDLKYALSYDTAEGARSSRQKATGEKTNVVGITGTVVIPNCYAVTPLVLINATDSTSSDDWQKPFTYKEMDGCVHKISISLSAGTLIEQDESTCPRWGNVPSVTSYNYPLSKIGSVSDNGIAKESDPPVFLLALECRDETGIDKYCIIYAPARVGTHGANLKFPTQTALNSAKARIAALVGIR
jgi:hypothetical protein